MPSTMVAAFYYPWYRTLHWEHPGTGASLAADDIAADYYPLLGPYASDDSAVVAQHMAWLRGAGVGVIVTSWWGADSYEDQVVPLLLEMGERYGIKVAFHIEPFADDRAARLVDDVRYLYRRYGDHPAFFRLEATGPFGNGEFAQPLLFLWAVEQMNAEAGATAPTDHWREAIDTIHTLPEGGLVLGTNTDAAWVRDSHLDGAYNYATQDLDSLIFAWAQWLPPGSLFVPSVLPGYDAQRVGYPSSTYRERGAGSTYDTQWQLALSAGVEPALVTITSFNEWHEGSQIEPALAGHSRADGRPYDDYSPLAPDAYLDRTRGWVEQYAAIDWPEAYRVRLQMRTTADWTRARLLDGSIARVELVASSPTATDASYGDGWFVLTQSIDDANSDNEVSATFDFELSDVTSDTGLSLEIWRGSLGATRATLFNYLGAEPVEVDSLRWSGITDDPNARTFPVDPRLLIEPVD